MYSSEEEKEDQHHHSSLSQSQVNVINNGALLTTS